MDRSHSPQLAPLYTYLNATWKLCNDFCLTDHMPPEALYHACRPARNCQGQKTPHMPQMLALSSAETGPASISAPPLATGPYFHADWFVKQRGSFSAPFFFFFFPAARLAASPSRVRHRVTFETLVRCALRHSGWRRTKRAPWDRCWPQPHSRCSSSRRWVKAGVKMGQQEWEQPQAVYNTYAGLDLPMFYAILANKAASARDLSVIGSLSPQSTEFPDTMR
ncbi:hypothetical protein B0J12DRAFT_345414 [Macrophomina phaseolina]|uniref:Uncharacterized protein n=1 Tax=Macrophomina phaseolina TaxID=35725 RepID=A0ABQ8GMD4_9PEZI|nr:hypothetical protein B0J12DRAFT_345414 [Macrophomina phaseolina]